MIVLLALVAGCALFTIIFWMQVVALRREVHRLVTDGVLSDQIRGPRLLREIHQDLHQLAQRQKEIARQVAAEDFSLRAILTSMVEGVLVADGQSRIRLTNHRLQQMFSLAKSPVDRTVMEVFRNHLLQQVIKQTLETEEPRFAELQVEMDEGGQFQTKQFQLTCVKLQPRELEGPAGALVIFHDVTQIRSLEAVRKEFIANVSHELRTPLSIITGYLETLIDGGIDPELSLRFLKIMRKHALRLNLIIEDLLALSRLESREINLHFEPVSISACVERVLEQLDSRIREVGAVVTVNLPNQLPKIEADAFRFDPVLFNLVENALKHGGKTGLKIVVDGKQDGEWVQITVQDNGPGIPLMDQPHIFERFFRVHKDRSRDAGGTGLGLSIVKHTVQAHGGSIAVESIPGAGAKFLIRLPIRQAP
jgi:two-component system, OmpR family, phosphate regulon sensor histidine kinase PhoR